MARETEDDFGHHLSYRVGHDLIMEYCNSRQLARTRIEELGLVVRKTGNPWSPQITYGVILSGDMHVTEVRYTKRRKVTNDGEA